MPSHPADPMDRALAIITDLAPERISEKLGRIEVLRDRAFCEDREAARIAEDVIDIRALDQLANSVGRLSELKDMLASLEYDGIRRKLRELQEVIEEINSALRTDLPSVLPVVSIQFLVELREMLERQEHYNSALARVNFSDDHYELIRVIDGDTVVVSPPAALRDVMKDVHIRLYGIETPELYEPKGDQYRQYLSDLCSIDAKGRLFVLWERERAGTNYEGFPRTSFERGVGHLFMRTVDGGFLYINGLMQVLRLTTVERKGRPLLRGASLLSSLRVVNEYDSWHPCQTKLSATRKRESETFRRISRLNPPSCLLLFRQLPSLHPDDLASDQAVAETLSRGLVDKGCAFTRIGVTLERLASRKVFSENKMSPFDISLSLVCRWSLEVSRA